jgi:hypothetical protein
MAKKTKNDYGVYKVQGDSFILKKGGFANSYECEKWIRNQVKSTKGDADLSGEFAIMSLRRKFSLETKSTVSVKLVDSGG